MIDNPYGDPPKVALHDVEWRIDGRPNQQGDTWRARYVPYIDARWLAAGLDEWVGPQNWRRTFTHQTFRNLECVVCTVEIRFGDEWVGKPDIGLIEGGGQTGTKGTYSDAFKRAACVAWGVGRNVYELPGDIWAECKVRQNPKAKGEHDKWQAYPHPNAVLQIRVELEKRGHEILHVNAQPKVGSLSADTDGTDEDAATIDQDQIDTLKEQFSELTGETLKAAQAEFFREWGKAADIAARNYDSALDDAQRIAASHAAAPSPGDAATPPAAPGDPPAEAPPSAPADEPDSPQESVPAEAVGLTLEEIDSMTARGLAEHLAQFGLDLTGNMAAKKARLKEHVSKTAHATTGGPGATMEMWQAGANLPAHPETGEALSTTAEYVDGISKYEDALDDEPAMLWNAWLAETFPDGPWPPTAQHTAFVAYQTIHHLHTHGELPDA